MISVFDGEENIMGEAENAQITSTATFSKLFSFFMPLHR